MKEFEMAEEHLVLIWRSKRNISIPHRANVPVVKHEQSKLDGLAKNKTKQKQETENLDSDVKQQQQQKTNNSSNKKQFFQA